MTVLTGSLILFSATMAMAADVKTVLTNQFQDYVKDLEFITNIDSGTGNANGSAKIAAFLKGKMEALGATVELRKNAQGTHVIARLKGEGVLRLLFLMHTDTVFEAGEAVKRPFRIDENQIAYGPGAGDDKASTIQAIYFVQALKALDYKKYGEILLYFDAEEEVGSATEDAIVVELAQKADVAFVLDTGRPGWGITWSPAPSGISHWRTSGVNSGVISSRWARRGGSRCGSSRARPRPAAWGCSKSGRSSRRPASPAPHGARRPAARAGG